MHTEFRKYKNLVLNSDWRTLWTKYLFKKT